MKAVSEEEARKKVAQVERSMERSVGKDIRQLAFGLQRWGVEITDMTSYIYGEDFPWVRFDPEHTDILKVYKILGYRNSKTDSKAMKTTSKWVIEPAHPDSPRDPRIRLVNDGTLSWEEMKKEAEAFGEWLLKELPTRFHFAK